MADNYTGRLNGANSAFLTVSAGGKTNTMTIGWGFEGIIWGKKTFVVMVRQERYTYELIEKADFFTVSFPKPGEFREALNHFGTKSGRDIDKYESGLVELVPAQSGDGFYIAGCESHVECRIVYSQLLDRDGFRQAEAGQRFYPTGSGAGNGLHALYFGEIVGG